MSAESIEFTSIGNYRIISWSDSFKNVTNFNGWIIDTEGESFPHIYLYLEYRWSINGSNWSLWTHLDEESIQGLSLSPDSPFWIEIRMTAVSDEDSSPYYPPGTPLSPPIILNDFELDLKYKSVDPRDLMRAPVPLLGKELSNYPVVFNNSAYTFRPYEINRAVNLYQDLSNMVNDVFGHECIYYSVQPQGRGKDVVIKEYTIFNVVSEKCVKIMVPGNTFPDAAINFDSFGLNFQQPFEVHIDRKYFESIFGKGSQPRKRDILFLPTTNRIYQIDSMYVFKDINNVPVYFKVQLVKYEIRKNTNFINKDAESDLLDYTVNTEKLFGEEVKDQEIDITKPQQFAVNSQRMDEDPIRAYLSRNLPIIESELNNNWTIVFNHYYDLDRLFVDDPDIMNQTSPQLNNEEKDAVRWKAPLSLSNSEERSFMCWFRLRNYLDKSKLVPKASPKLSITIDTISTDNIIYTTYPIPHKLTMGNNPDGYVSILADGTRSGGFEIIEILDQYKFKVTDNGSTAPGNTSGWKMQKAQKRTLIDGYHNGTGLLLDIIWSGSNIEDLKTTTNFIQTGSFRMKINNLEVYSPFGAGISSTLGNFIPSADDWFGFVFNFSNVFRQYSMRVWKLTYDPDNPLTQTSDLSLVHAMDGITNREYTYSIAESIETDYDSPFYGTNNYSYRTKSSPIWITNLRLFKQMVEDEKQSAILNQNVVDDARLAIIIDNAKPQLKLPKVARNR